MAVTVRVPILFHRPLTFGGAGGSPVVAVVDQQPPPVTGPQSPCMGAQGAQGPQGNQGRQGFVGSKGAQGALGLQGVQGSGVQGPAGIQGPIGGIGSQGPIGLGAQGAQGQSGAPGPQGVAGTQGTQGTQGAQGRQGFQGSAGTAGSNGVQGPQGFQGSVGTAGSNGVQGPQGFQGRQGFQGVQGTQGNQGNQGFQGFQGVFAEIPTPVEVDPDLQMPMGTAGTFQSIQNNFVSTNSPTTGLMNVTIASAGNYVLFWYAEIGRGSAGGANRILARIRHTDPGGVLKTLANWRRINNIQNCSAVIPPDEVGSQMATDGDVFAWSGFDRVTMAQGNHTFALQFAADGIGNSQGQDVLHARRQKLMLLRVS